MMGENKLFFYFSLALLAQQWAKENTVGTEASMAGMEGFMEGTEASMAGMEGFIEDMDSTVVMEDSIADQLQD